MYRVTAHSNCPCLCRIASVTSITVVMSFTEDKAILISRVKLIFYWFSQAFLLNQRAIHLWLSAHRILFRHFSISIFKDCSILNTNTWASIKSTV
jgi:hypothetical protein